MASNVPGAWEAITAVVLAFWLVLLADRKRCWPSHWKLPAMTEGTSSEAGPATAVTVVVPARNEALVLRTSLPALLAQEKWIES